MKVLRKQVWRFALGGILLLGSESRAASEDTTLPVFTVSAKTSETSLLPGAPLYVYLTVTRGKDANPEAATVSITSLNNNIRTHIEDQDNKETKNRPEQPWSPYNGLEFNLFRPLAAGESYTKTLIVHRWSSTTLAPGEYTVLVEAPRLNFYMESNRDEWHPVIDPPFNARLPLKILAPDDDQVARIFDTMLTATIEEDVSWSDRYRALDSIVFAQGPAALKTQLGLLAAMDQDIVRFGYGQKEIVTMLWYIVQQAAVPTARALVDLARGPVFGPNLEGEDPSKRGIWPMLGWAIHELHRTGGSDVQAITEELVARVPDNPALVWRTFLEGGMEFEKDY